MKEKRVERKKSFERKKNFGRNTLDTPKALKPLVIVGIGVRGKRMRETLTKPVVFLLILDAFLPKRMDNL